MIITLHLHARVAYLRIPIQNTSDRRTNLKSRVSPLCEWHGRPQMVYRAIYSHTSQRVTGGRRLAKSRHYVQDTPLLARTRSLDSYATLHSSQSWSVMSRSSQTSRQQPNRSAAFHHLRYVLFVASRRKYSLTKPTRRGKLPSDQQRIIRRGLTRNWSLRA